MFMFRPGAKRYFDGWARDYDRDSALFDYAVPEIVAKALSAHLNFDAKVLDVGAGTGACSAALRQIIPSIHITGVDASAAMLQKCRAKNVCDRLLQSDLQRTPLPAGAWDGIIVAGILEFIGPRHGLIEQVAARLAPGGHAAFAYETVVTAHAYRGWTARQIARDDHGIIIRRIFPTFPLPHIFTKYLYDTRNVAARCVASGLDIVETARFPAYTRRDGMVITHDLVIASRPCDKAGIIKKPA